MSKTTPKPDHRYALSVEWSVEDQTWIGRCPEVMKGGVHGDDPAAVFAELQQAVAEHIADAAENGPALPPALAERTFSGKFVLRTSPQHHRQLAIKAHNAGQSLNNFVVAKLKD